MTTSTTALVQQMREALDWCVAEINRDSPSVCNARVAIAAADQWLANPPTNQCGETCERAKLCATCAGELDSPRCQAARPLQPDWRDWMTGMFVSVDVSTGDSDEGHRYFGTVTEVMDDPGEKHGVALLVQDAEPNFETTVARELTDDQIAVAFGWKAGYGNMLLTVEREIGRAIQRACADAWGVTLADGIGQPANEPGATE